jgi:hypothetical protein
MIQLNTNNIFSTLSYITPILVVLLIVLIGVIENQYNLSTLIYVSGAIVCEIINILYGTLTGNVASDEIKRHLNPSCHYFSGMGNMFGSSTLLSSSIIVLFFTITSVLYSMIYFNNMNLVLFTCLMGLVMNDGIQRLSKGCITRLNLFISAILGIIVSFIWYSVIVSIDDKLLLFSVSNSSNNVQCGKPNKNKFKCSVYKNGQLITK